MTDFYQKKRKKSSFMGQKAMKLGLSWWSLFIEGGVGKVYVFLVHALFGQGNRFAEAYKGKKIKAATQFGRGGRRHE